MFVPFVLGLASGGQAIYAKVGNDWGHFLRTWAGAVYCFSRGVVPVATYAVWYWQQNHPSHSVVAAITSGLCSEAALRSRFYLGEKKGSGGRTEEVSKGFFDLLAWYQGLCLRSAGESLAQERQILVETLLEAEKDFVQLAKRARLNASAWPIEEEKTKIQGLIDEQLAGFQLAAKRVEGDALQRLQRERVLELGYAALRHIRRGSLKTLFK